MTQEIDLTDSENSSGEIASITLTTEDSEVTFDSVEVNDVEFSIEKSIETAVEIESTRPDPGQFWFCGTEDDS